MNKKCSKCHNEYPATKEFFSISKRTYDGFFIWCKSCKRESAKKGYLKNIKKEHEKRKILRKINKEKIKIRDKRYRERLKNREIKNISVPDKRECPKCKIIKLNKDFYKNSSRVSGLSTYCKKCTNIKNRASYCKFKVKRSEHQKQYSKMNKEKIGEKNKRYYNENKDKIKKYKREWQEKNKERLSKKQKIYRKEHLEQTRKRHNNRKKTDINYKIICNLRSRLSVALKRCSKSKNTIALIGCTIEQLKTYLKSNFSNGMTFDNYGIGPNKWSLDHIIPCAAFDLSDPKQQEKCFHYSNIAPLWNIDNFKKNSLYNGKYIRSEHNKKNKE